MRAIIMTRSRNGLVVERARLGRDRDFGLGHLGLDGARQPIGDGGDAIEWQRAADADLEIDKKHRARRAGAHAIDCDDAGHLPRDRTDPLADTRRRGVGQRIDGASAEPPAGNADEDRDHDCRRRISPRIAERDAAEADQHRDRRPHVGAEMKRVSLERLARSFRRDARECARAEKIDDNRAGDDSKRRGRRFNPIKLRAPQPLHGLPDHRNRKHEQQRRLRKRGDALHFAVTVLVFGVGWLAGNADGEIGHHRRREIEQRMAGLGQDCERTGEQTHDSLRGRQPCGSGNRSERDLFLLIHPRPLARKR